MNKKLLTKIISSIAIFLIIIFALIVTTLYLLTPRIADYNQEIAHYLQGLVEQPVTIENISAKWYGWKPIVQMQNVKIWDDSKQSVLTQIGDIHIHLNILDLIMQKQEPTTIVLSNANVTFLQLPDQTFQLLGATKHPDFNINSILKSLSSKDLNLNNIQMNFNLLSGKTIILKTVTSTFKFEHVNAGQNPVEVIAELKDAEFKFDPHWPPLEHLDAQIIFRNEEMLATIYSGEVGGGYINDATVTIPEISRNGFDVLIKGDLTSTAEQGILFLHETPLWEDLKDKFEPLIMTGPIDLDLTLDIPVDYPEKRKTVVLGNVELKEVNVRVPTLDLEFTDVNGDLVFNQDSIYTNYLTAMFYKLPVKVKITTESQVDLHSYIKLVMDGTLDMKSVQERYQNQFVFQDFQGVTAFNAIVQWRDETDPVPSQLQIISSLEGLKITLPTPFNKMPEEIRPFVYTSTFGQGQEELQISYGNILKAILYESNVEPETLTHGTVAIQTNQSIPMPARGLKIVGELASLDIDAWQPIVQRYMAETAVSTSSLPDIDAQITTNNIHILDYNLATKRVTAKHQHQEWNIDILGQDINGQIHIADAKLPIDLQLTNLSLQDTSATTKREMQPPGPDFPHLNVNINRLLINNKDLGKVVVVTETQPNKVLINKFSFEKPSFVFSGTGSWHWPNQQSVTNMQGSIATPNVGQMLQDINIFKGMVGSTGTTSVDLQWPGAPFAWDLDTISGKADIGWRNGRLVDINPGLGRILSLLSVRGIPRRLHFDYSDIFRPGLTFDKMTATLSFDKGRVSTQNGEVITTSGTITFAGTADIPHEQLDMNVTVSPSANPVVDVALWAVDTIASPFAHNVTKFSYHVTGPWQAPVMTPISNNASNASNAQ